jgi:hypothetical protein
MIRLIVFPKRLLAMNAPMLLYRWPVGQPPRFLTRLTVRQCDALQICRRFGPGRYVLRQIQKNGDEYSKSFRLIRGRYGSCPRRRMCWIRT